MEKGLIFSIEEFSVFDGPGIRSTVFLKGCPLKCSWCHNPEGQSFKKEILVNRNECVHCGRCKAEAIRLTGKSELCEECVRICPKNLIRVSGIEYTSEELCEKLRKNKVFYKGGGVTFSGGEPLAQPHFLAECLANLKNEIHTAIQTSGFCEKSVFDEILSLADMFLFDLKIIDNKKAKRYIGADNSAILKNFDALASSDKSFIVRIPLIPEAVATAENLNDIIKLLKFYKVNYAEALPYNKFAGAKYRLCGREYAPDFDENSLTEPPTELFSKNGIKLKIL